MVFVLLFSQHLGNGLKKYAFQIVFNLNVLQDLFQINRRF
jgi:hypothetical protein